MEQQIAATVAEAPPPMSLAAHIAAEEAPAAAPVVAPAVTETPAAPVEAAAPAVAPVVDEQAAQAEADSVKADAELSEAGRMLRANRADKRAARIKAENDDLARELHRRQQLRSEVERFATAPTPTTGGSPVGTTPAGTPTGAEPTLDAFMAAITAEQPTHPDPYGAAIEARVLWRLEQRQQAETRTRQQHDAARELDAKADAARAKFSDFDAVTDPVIAQLRGTPRGATLADYLRTSEVAGEIMYRLGTEPAALQAVLAAGDPVTLTRRVALIEADLVAPRRETAKPITQAPAPPSQTVGGSATTPDVDPRKGVPLKDHIRIEEAELAERRSRGLRN